MFWSLFLKCLYFTILFFYIGLIIYDFYYFDDIYKLTANDIVITYRDGSTIKAKEFKKVKKPEDVIKIDCNGCRLNTLEGIQSFSNLEELDCSRNVLVSLICKDANPILPASLVKLKCSRNYIQTLFGIEHCINLTELDCSTNYITFLTSLRELVNLRSLKCSSNRLTTLFGIDKSVNLRELHCDANYISFLPIFILEFKELYDFNIEGNPIEMTDVIIGSEVESFVSKINGKKLSRVKVYNDTQNTHNSAIVKAVKSSIQNIMKEEPVALETLNI